MNLRGLTDRELTLLLGHSLYLGHVLKTAARAEQKARLYVGPRSEAPHCRRCAEASGPAPAWGGRRHATP